MADVVHGGALNYFLAGGAEACARAIVAMARQAVAAVGARLPLAGLGGGAGDRCPPRAAFERASVARRRAPWGVAALPHVPRTDRRAPGPGAAPGGGGVAVAALEADVIGLQECRLLILLFSDLRILMPLDLTQF